MDYWEGRFTPATESNVGGINSSMYRTCLRCLSLVSQGAEAEHVRRCDYMAALDDEALREQIRREHQLQAWRDRGVL